MLAALVALAIAKTHRASPRRSDPSEVPGAARAQHTVALATVVGVLAIACLPFVVNERTGVLGEGIYTNDQAAQLYWADWLASGSGPQPNAVRFGYPVGPQALVASISDGTGFDLVDVFNGLLIAIPALTALTALSLLAMLPPLRRGLAAALTGLPYLGASFLAQSGFKETAMALFVLALAATLTAARRRARDQRHEPPPPRSVAAVLALLALGAVFTFSIPGAAWFALAIPPWLMLSFDTATRARGWTAARAWAGAHLWVLVAASLVIAGIAALVLGPTGSFISRIGDVQESSGRLSSPVWPGEALGIWPEGDFRLVRGEVDGALLATGFATLCLAAAAISLIRRRDWALICVLGAAGGVYALARPFAEIHVEAKALAVLAPLAMLVTVGWLLAPRSASKRTPWDVVRVLTAAVFCVAALGSTLLALRATPVGFDDRGRDLEVLAERAEGERLAFLGIDRFAAYWLRDTLVRSPGGYVPPEVGSRGAKTWQQGLPVDFDTIEPKRLEDFRFAITTAAGFQSIPPPAFREVARQGEYVLYKRKGPLAPTQVLTSEGGNPGAVLACGTEEANAALARGGDALVVSAPVVAGQEDWQPAFHFDAPSTARQTLAAPEGEFRISLQYHSQVPLTVRLDDVQVATLPPTLAGFYLVGAGRGAYWAAGQATASGSVEIEVEAARPSGLQRALGVPRSVWLGGVALTATGGSAVKPLARSCGEYVDHYLPAGSDEPLLPTRP